MKRPQLVSAGSLNRMIQAANESYERRDFQQGIEILERTSRFDPANWQLRFQLGHFYGLNYDNASAERCFEQAIRMQPDKREALATAASLSLDFANHKLAEQYYRRATEQKNAPPEIFAKLAELYERLHRKDDAIRLTDQALQLDDNCDLARLTRAKLYRRAGRLTEAEQLLHRFSTTDRYLQIRRYYELGANLDLQGRYDEAMSAFLKAKALLRPDAPPLLAQLQSTVEYLNQMQKDVSAEMFQRWFDSGAAFQPTRRLALLCGHARSGTTLLEQVLDSHPDIVSADETVIFHDQVYMPLTRGLPNNEPMLSILEAVQINTLQRVRANYFRLVELSLGKPVANRLLIDKNPSYNFMIPAFARIFPETKFLVALRDPRDVVLSSFMLAHLPMSKITVAALTLEGTVETYIRKMGIWQTLKPLIKNSFLEVRYEDVVNDLESVARRTLEFLGMPWDARVLGFDEHARQKIVRSPTYADVTKPLYKGAVGRWRNYQKYLEPHLEKLEPFVKAFGYE